jgi:8-oxo-dGTP pyrophosphatase MutT (NUDIX family)
MVKQLPIRVRSAHKSDVRSQFGALCFRRAGGKTQILLITSRRQGRWIIPKGWPVDRQTPAQAAAREAWEEAGVKGQAHDRCLGLYSYFKTYAGIGGFPCVVMVYPVEVKSLGADYPEAGQRKRRWFSPKKAAAKVAEPELAKIIRGFDPRTLT